MAREALSPLDQLLAVLLRTAAQGCGHDAWGPPLHDPISFVLDAIADAVVVRTPAGELLASNRAARSLPPLLPLPAAAAKVEELSFDGGRWLRRTLFVECGEGQVVVEVLRVLAA